MQSKGHLKREEKIKFLNWLKFRWLNNDIDYGKDLAEEYAKWKFDLDLGRFVKFAPFPSSKPVLNWFPYCSVKYLQNQFGDTHPPPPSPPAPFSAFLTEYRLTASVKISLKFNCYQVQNFMYKWSKWAFWIPYRDNKLDEFVELLGNTGRK